MAGCLGHYPPPPSFDTPPTQHGVASWYGPNFHGKTTASGEPYNMRALTAAHRTLPFGTWVQVKTVATGKTVTVKINDRGPFIKGRIIDLSYAAARELRMIGDGTAEVTLTILDGSQASTPSPLTTKHFWVQAGAFTSLPEAMMLRERLARTYAHVRVNSVSLPSGEWHRVQVGAFNSRAKAQTVAAALQKNWGVKATLLSTN